MEELPTSLASSRHPCAAAVSAWDTVRRPGIGRGPVGRHQLTRNFSHRGRRGRATPHPQRFDLGSSRQVEPNPAARQARGRAPTEQPQGQGL